MRMRDNEWVFEIDSEHERTTVFGVSETGPLALGLDMSFCVLGLMRPALSDAWLMHCCRNTDLLGFSGRLGFIGETELELELEEEEVVGNRGLRGWRISRTGGVSSMRPEFLFSDPRRNKFVLNHIKCLKSQTT